MKNYLFVVLCALLLPAVAGAFYQDYDWYYPSYPYSSFTGQGYYTGAGQDPYYYGFVGNQNPIYQPSYYPSGSGGYPWSSYTPGGYGGSGYGYGYYGMGGQQGYGGYAPQSSYYGSFDRMQYASPRINVYAPQTASSGWWY